MAEKQFNYNVNTNAIERDDEFFAYLNVVDAHRIVNELNELDELKIQAKKEIEFLDHQIQMLERRNTRQAKHLEKIYNLICKKQWCKLEALYMDTKQDYEEI